MWRKKILKLFLCEITQQPHETIIIKWAWIENIDYINKFEYVFFYFSIILQGVNFNVEMEYVVSMLLYFK